jgi:hypothetical protein
VTLMPQDLLLRRPLCGRRVYPWEKLQVKRPDLPLLQLQLVCERASLWAKPLARQPLTATRWSQLLRLWSPLFYAPDVSLALALVIHLDWAIDLARYKLRRIRLQKAEQEFLWS